MVFWSRVGSALNNIVSGACNVISSVASKIGNTLSEVATSVVKLGVTLAYQVGDSIKKVGISLGIINPDDNFEQLGEKAMMSEKTPEDFESISNYIEHLRNEVTVDKEKFNLLDDKELLARSAIGAAITLKGINEKLGTVVTPQFMAVVAKQNLEAKEIIATINAYKENKLKTSDYSLYINDELSIEQSYKHSSALVEAYKKVDPELSIEQIEDKVMGLKS